MGVTVVAAGLGGLLLAVSGFGDFSRGLLAARLRPYLGIPDPDSPALRRGIRGVSGSARPGRTVTPPLLTAAGVTLGLGLGLGLIGRATSARSGLLLALVTGLAAMGWPKWRRARDDRRRRDHVLIELPTFVDLVGLALAAGEGVRGSLELVAGTPGGSVVEEVRRALGKARVGESLAEALQESATRLAVPAFSRFVGLVVASAELGAPMGESLRALAFDVREDRKRRLIEKAARQEVSMIVPVVGLILPVAVVFALFPGIAALRELSP